MRATTEGLSSNLRQFLQERLPEHMIPSAFVVLDEVPLTPSGKLDRKALPAPGASGAQDRSAMSSDFIAPRTAIEQEIARIWQQSLGQEQIGVYDRFFELGGDSILAVQVVSRAARAGIHFTPKQLFQYPTIAELASVATMSTDVAAEQGIVTGAVPLTPIQRWFFEQQRPDPQHFNQALLLNAHQRLDPDLLDRALQHLLRHHDALRLRFERTPDGWQQHNAAPDERSLLQSVDVSAATDAEASARLETIAAELHGSLDLEHGPLLRAALFDHGPQRLQRLLLIVHHLVVDGLSWRVLVDDLQTAYEQISNQRTIALPPKTTSFKQWAERLQGYAQTPELQRELGYWRDLAQQELAPLPVDHEQGVNSVGSAQTVSAALSVEATQALLQTAPAAYNTQVNDLLLAALVQSFAAWTGSSRLRIDLEGHGRESLFEAVDLSRTVGWFTTLVPLLLDLAGADEPGSAIKTIKEQLRQVPQRGIGFGVLRYLSADTAIREQLATLPPAQITFNYLGQTDQQVGGFFSLAPDATGPLQSPRGRRSHLLDINGIVVDGRLRVDWTYSEHMHERATIERLATAYIAALQRLIDHCLAPGVGGYTPSDFPLVAIDQPTLDRLIGQDRQIEDLFALTPVQQGMLFHTLYDPQAGTYLNQLSAELAGKLDIEAFQRAWQSAVQRHPALRSSFVWQGLDQPIQIVRKTVDLAWTIDDWRDLAAEEQQARLERYLADDRGRGFDLTTAPLLRFALFRTADERYHFVWSYHHLLLDGWSLPIVLQDVWAEYAATHDQPSPRPQPRPYRDYLAWLRRQDLTAAETFWRQMLADVSAATPLGVDQPARREPRSGYGLSQTQLDAATTERLQTLARQHGLTLSTLIQGAWALLLGVYSGENDVLFGVTVAGRPPELPGSETMVGLLINTLPLRVHLAPDRPLAEWLAELQARQVDLRQFEYTPLPQIQEWSAVPRGQPLFESIVVFENYPVADAVREGPQAALAIDAVQSHEQTNYPLTILAASGRQLELRLSYDRSRFATTTIERMLAHLTALLSGIAEQPEQPLAALSPLTDDERRQIVEQWNDTQTSYPQIACLHQLFEAQVERTPEAIALIFEDQQLSYDVLNRRANQLAHHLQTLGVGPDVAVGICAERSPELVIGLLGILKAGGAYVPFDPGYPAERLHYMLEDAQAPVLLAQAQLTDRLQLDSSAQPPRVVLLDADQERLAREPETNPHTTVDLDNLAYIIYTSGSTGQPKGAMNTHRAIGNRLLWMQDMYGLTAADRVLQKTPFSFDVSVWEFFWPLLAGATLVVAKPGGHQDPAYLAALMQRERITTTHFVPSMLRIFLEEPSIAQIQHLRRVICSGEALPAETEMLFFERMQAELHNLYGPTEAAVDVSYWPCRRDRRAESVPIGYPVANTQLYILNRQMQPVPMGVAGELYIGGVQLARGYLSRPALTASTFLPDPFANIPGSRLYRTGDLARHLPDGAIEFLGRLDHQVKVHGFRIELGEIEAALRRHEQITDTVAIVREDVPGDRRIVAYVVEEQRTKEQTETAIPPRLPQRERGAGGEGLSPESLRRFLLTSLPAYRVPSAFVTLDALPLSPNGKLDRRALPEPEQTRPELEEAFVAPRTDLEQDLAAIWQQVLRVDRVGIHDNFFALGGDSILSLQVTARAAALDMHISPRHIFEHPTIAELMRALDTTTTVEAEQGIVTGPVALTPVQEWFFEQPLREPHHWNQALLLEARQPLDPALLEQSIQRLVAHHDALRLRFERTPDGWQQHNADLVEQPIVTHVDLAMLDEAGQIAAVAEEGNRLHGSLNLADGPLLRVALFECGTARPQRLLIVVHHLAIDGVAWRILLEDLQSVYGQLSQEQQVALPPKTTSFQHWAARLEEYAQSPALQPELRYWLDPVRNAAQPLPIDHPDGTNAVSAQRTAAVTLSAQETTALLQQVPRVYRTQINDLLLAALAEACAEWTGSQTLLIDLEGHGRNLPLDGLDLSRTIGWFTAIFPVLLTLESSGQPETTIKAIKEQLRAIPNHGIGYGVLRYLGAESEIRRQLAALPAAQISFNYLGQLDHTLSEGTLLHLVREPSGDARSPRDERRYELDITAYVVGGELRVEWTYSAARFDDATIERVAQLYQTALRALIRHCLTRTSGGVTPSDFPLTNMNQKQLDGVLAKLRKRKQGRAE
ncbi:MAG TPA: amino acid adenylation domain-containing protein [Herpetosiphonaceae bacterium]